MDRIAATLAEIELWLHDRLRAQPFTLRLKGVHVIPSESADCGWLAEVIGEFSVDEHALANTIVSDLQRRFCLSRQVAQKVKDVGSADSYDRP